MVNENYVFFLFYLRNWIKDSTKLTVHYSLKCYEKYYFNKINKTLIYALILINEISCVSYCIIHKQIVSIGPVFISFFKNVEFVEKLFVAFLTSIFAASLRIKIKIKLF